ncbi:MAG TPA: hypothetical protein VFK41_08920 [Nocardioidaceae bacterium]|nr:hypothetical protein [Nocardioidaceae bacterium]
MKRKPSISFVLAIVALVVAMTGSAVAGSLITSAQIKDGTIKMRDLSRATKTALRDHEAFATVDAAGNVSNGSGITGANVVQPDSTTGFYCFTGLSFTPKNAQVSLVEPFPVGETLGLAARVALNAGVPFNCPAGTKAIVTIRKDAGGLEDHAFSILFN